MIHPSYVDLMNVVNKGVEEGEEPVISSRYSIVMATAKRARQLVAGDEVMIEANPKDKPLSIAVKELYADKLAILTDEEKEAMAELIAQKNSEVEGQKAAAALEETVEVSEEETEEE
ncbi:RNA polymerase Rpb6 [Butyrivibrio fibrisolvens DSM 3071]|uniref:DNA-directed RNA polymerase subunit omega n=1 Tax=Butyrivibrio fibrisolvens DSM 3071 TaxID=1121131 RepID=A0A1M5X433_BUTFI|nr:DNA-directed RNA polymerase subunit omega [Butyrivibrio fibrisolvens]SHH94308.1 RNA polymerase Rpb6 [Butyrivibrio fibrisolvens DSM 3071]